MEVKLRTARTLVDRLRAAVAVRDAAAAAAVVSELRLLTKNDSDIHSPLADAGAVLILAGLLSSPSSSEDAAAALLNISISAREQLMSTPGLLDALVVALRTDGSSSAHHAAATVHSLLCVEAYRPIIGAKRHLLAALVSLVRAAPSTRATKDALKALFGVALYPLNRAALVELGLMQVLFALVVTDGRSGVVEDATVVIAQVAGCAESVEAFRKAADVRILVDLAEPGVAATPRARENATAALLNLVMAGGERAVTEVMAVGGADEAVRALAEDGGSRRPPEAIRTGRRPAHASAPSPVCACEG